MVTVSALHYPPCMPVGLDSLLRRHRTTWGLVSLALAACTRSAGPADAGATEAAPPPAIEVTAARTDLVFSYPEEGGRRFATATRIDDIPTPARKEVVVTDLSLSPEVRQAGRYIYLANLSKARDDGTFPVALASRYGFEVNGTATATAAAARGARQVVIYSASWCGVCKTAKRLMKSWGVPFVEKDIEASRAAQQELAAKAAAKGFRPGGVPVIDVDGVILQGLDERTLRQVLSTAGYLPKG